MGTPNFIQRHLNQTLVYWGNPQDDGEGGFTFDSAVEIIGRCEYKVEQVVSGNGELTVSRARVYLAQEVDQGGYLYLGTLDDSEMVDSAPHPDDISESMRIMVFEKIPRLEGPGYLYKAYLNKG